VTSGWVASERAGRLSPRGQSFYGWSMSPNSGRIIGSYVLTGVAGRGGMAVVYVARQAGLEREIALKELAALHVGDAHLVGRFLRESRVAASLNHPNIVTVHDFFEHDGIPYIAMEYLPWGSLRGLVGKLTQAQIMGVLESVLSGLEHAENHGIVHRDLKPENLLISGEGRIKIADFGIAKAVNATVGDSVRTATGMAIGTPSYMAPEQALGQPVGPRTDLYALGAIGFELLAGRPPFEAKEGDTPLAVLFKHVNEPPPDLRELMPGADPGLAAWVERLLAKEPDERPVRASAASELLEDVAVAALGPRWRRDCLLPVSGRPPKPAPLPGPMPTVGTPPSGHAAHTPAPTEPRRRRVRPLVVGTAILLAAALIAAVAIATTGGGAHKPGALSAQVPRCIRRFLAGTVANETLVLGVANRYLRAGTEGRPVGLALGTGRPLGALRLVHHLGPSEYFQVQGAMDAASCRPVRVTDLVTHTVVGNASPYDDLEVFLGGHAYDVRPGVQSPLEMEVGFHRLPTPT
jgi:serine/threonine protein kinase